MILEPSGFCAVQLVGATGLRKTSMGSVSSASPTTASSAAQRSRASGGGGGGFDIIRPAEGRAGGRAGGPAGRSGGLVDGERVRLAFVALC